jgi:hypothetical protein
VPFRPTASSFSGSLCTRPLPLSPEWDEAARQYTFHPPTDPLIVNRKLKSLEGGYVDHFQTCHVTSSERW